MELGLPVPCPFGLKSDYIMHHSIGNLLHAEFHRGDDVIVGDQPTVDNDKEEDGPRKIGLWQRSVADKGTLVIHKSATCTAADGEWLATPCAGGALESLCSLIQQ
eukprot:1134970-Amphidinium_carterae.1